LQIDKKLEKNIMDCFYKCGKEEKKKKFVYKNTWKANIILIFRNP
jgi:hypothetical protein